MSGSKPAVECPRCRALSTLILFAFLFALTATLYVLTPRHESAPLVETPPADSSAHAEAARRRLIIGEWQDDYEGKRTMTLRPDGTGTMVVELSGLKAALAAPRLRFDMKWAVNDGRLQKQTIGGEPEGTVQFILKTMGDRVDEPILELTQERLLLLDKDGKTKYDWRRITESPPEK